MKLQDQCCTIDQSKRLKELGVTGESIFSWKLYKNNSEDKKSSIKLGFPNSCKYYFSLK